MGKETQTITNLSDSPEFFTMEQRNYWCQEFNCSMKDLVMAEARVGANPGLISKYLNENKTI